MNSDCQQKSETSCLPPPPQEGLFHPRPDLNVTCPFLIASVFVCVLSGCGIGWSAVVHEVQKDAFNAG